MIQGSMYKVHIMMGSKILTIFQIVELSVTISQCTFNHVGVNSGSSMGLTLLHDDGLDTSLILPGDAISTLIFFWGVSQEHAPSFHTSSCMSTTLVPSPPTGKTHTKKPQKLKICMDYGVVTQECSSL